MSLFKRLRREAFSRNFDDLVAADRAVLLDYTTIDGITADGTTDNFFIFSGVTLEGRKILLPKGTIRIESNALCTLKNTWLCGHGEGVTTLEIDADVGFILQERCKISDLSFTIAGVTALFQPAALSQCVFENVSCVGDGGTEIFLRPVDGTSLIEVRSSLITDVADVLVPLSSGHVDRVKFYDCTIEGVTRGVQGSIGALTMAYDAIDATSYSINITGSDTQLISISDCELGRVECAIGDLVLFYRNRVLYNTAIAVTMNDIGRLEFKHNVVEKTAAGYTLNGLRVATSPTICDVTDNVFIGQWERSIYINSSDAIVCYNTIRDNDDGESIRLSWNEMVGRLEENTIIVSPAATGLGIVSTLSQQGPNHFMTLGALVEANAYRLFNGSRGDVWPQGWDVRGSWTQAATGTVTIPIGPIITKFPQALSPYVLPLTVHIEKVSGGNQRYIAQIEAEFTYAAGWTVADTITVVASAASITNVVTLIGGNSYLYLEFDVGATETFNYMVSVPSYISQ